MDDSIDGKNTSGGQDKPGAIIRFRRDQVNSGVSRRGRLRPGGHLRIEYDPARLLPDRETEATTTDMLCHLLFQPGGQQRGGSLYAQRVPAVPTTSQLTRFAEFEVDIPSTTTEVEVWFERRNGQQTTGWDSCFGSNYRFPVVSEGLPVPGRSVAVRPDAVVDASRIQVVEDSASKDQLVLGGTGTRLQAGLTIRAQVRAVSAVTAAWADVHVFDAMDDLIQAERVSLHELEAPEVDAEVHMWRVDVYQGSGGGSGSGVWSRPDAHAIQYRLYCQVGEDVFTDGVLHQFDVPADTEVRPIAGG